MNLIEFMSFFRGRSVPEIAHSISAENVVSIVATTFLNREKKIIEDAVRHSRREILADLERRGMAIKWPPRRRINADYTICAQSLAANA